MAGATNARDSDLSHVSPKLWRTRTVERAFAGKSSDQLQLAYNFLEGSNGFQQDNKRAVYWLTQSSNNGNIQAINQLGVCYIEGVGIIKNESVGYDLVKFAADKGNITAIINVALLAVNGCGISVNYTLAAEYLQKAAEAGDGQAAYELGQLYLQGKGVEKDENKAFQSLTLAADTGLMEAQVGLAQCYASGIGTEADLQAARKYWVTASLSGDAVAQRSIGERLLFGSDGFACDPEKARRFLARAADKGDAQAMYQLALCCDKGIGGPQDKVARIKWLEKAAELNHPKALVKLQYYLKAQLKFETDFRDSTPELQEETINEKEKEGNHYEKAEDSKDANGIDSPESPKKLVKSKSFILRMFKKVSGSAAH